MTEGRPSFTRYMAAVGAAGLVGQHAVDDLDSRRLKACEALAMGERRRIRRPDHEPPQAARDDQIGAGRAIIAVGTCGARLERHVERRSAGGFARLFQRKPLGGGRPPAL